jgi:enoyl-CoA hydratase
VEARRYDTILTSREDRVAIITLNRPQNLNALSLKLMEELADALEAFDSDPGVGAIVLTGNDRAFSAGADIKEMADMKMVEMLLERRFLLWERIRRVRKPMVAAVSGYCLGGGLELAMTCDMIVASERSQFGQPEINIGVIPGAGGTQRLTRLVGKHKAMEMVLTGMAVDAWEAHRLGIVNRVVPPELYLEEAKRLAAEVASKAPIASILAKEAVLRAMDTPVEVGLEYERKLFYLLFATEDKEEGMRSFLEKRKPQFKGR